MITGNTGSGKTMIFDAICYALFGDVSGQYREIDTLRSQFASREDITYVKFEFSHRNKDYIITRSPEQFKISRGKEILQRAKAEILIGNEVVSGIKNVNQEIKNILGIDHSQFKQIVMIAQGEFRDLVSADSRNRESIYRKIFNTMEFENIQNTLKERASEYEKKFDNFDQRIRGLLDSINSIKLISYEDLTINQVLDVLSKEVEIYDNKLKELKPKKEYYKNEILRNNNFFDSFNSLIARKNELSSFDISSLKDEGNFLDKVKKTFLIRDKEKVLENFKDTRDGYEKEIEKIIFDLNFHKNNLDVLNKEFEETKSYDIEIENLKSKIIDLESLKNTVEEKQKHEFKIKDLEKELLDLDDNKESIKKELEIFDRRYNQILSFSIEHKDIKEKILYIESDLLNLEGIKEGLLKYESELKIYEKLNIECEKCESKYNKIFDLYENKTRELSLSEDIYFRNQAGFLANKLEDGCPCIVCGSTIHPNKANLVDVSVNEESLKELRNEILMIKKELEETVTLKINLNKDVKSKEDRIREIYEDVLKKDKTDEFISFKEFELCEDTISRVKLKVLSLRNSLNNSRDINNKYRK